MLKNKRVVWVAMVVGLLAYTICWALSPARAQDQYTVCPTGVIGTLEAPPPIYTTAPVYPDVGIFYGDNPAPVIKPFPRSVTVPRGYVVVTMSESTYIWLKQALQLRILKLSPTFGD